MEFDWADEEFSLLKLGDVRVDKSGKKIIKTLASQPGLSIPQLFETHSEVNGCYEFFHNGKVTAKKILKSHKNATLKRIKLEPIILLPQDTSSFNYSTKLSIIDDLGNISGKNNQGLFLHPLIAITPARINLGLVDAKIWAREQRIEKLTRKQIYALPIEEKERFRWAESYHIACKLAQECPDTQVITITDREGDFAELFEVISESQKNSKFAHAIIRGNHDRVLINDKKEVKDQKTKSITNEERIKIEEEEEFNKKLVSKLKNSPTLGTITFIVPATKDRIKREVTQSIKVSRISFKKRISGSSCVTMNVVMAVEESPPKGETPYIWWFLTTLPIDTVDQAIQVIEYYLARWEIEVFFKILKSGCKAEDRRLNHGALIPLLAAFLVIAWRIMYAMKLGRAMPDVSCEILFSAAEWKPLWIKYNNDSKLPEKPPRLGEFIIMIARLGGYLNRKNDPPPGPTVMWKGMTKMHAFKEAWELFGHD